MKRDVHQRINRFSLKINDKTLEKEYRNASVEDSINQFRYAYIMGILFFMSFIIIDYKAFPEVASTYVNIQLFMVVPVLILCLISTFIDAYKFYARYVNLITVMAAGLGIMLMLIYGAESSNISMVYSSVILVLMFLYAFFKMPFRDAFIVGTTMVVGFLYIEHLIIQPSEDIYLIHIFSLMCANITGASIAYVMEYQSKKELLLKKTLSESVIKYAITGLYNSHYFYKFLVTDI